MRGDVLYWLATGMQIYAYIFCERVRIETITLAGVAYWLAVLAAFKWGNIR